MANAFNITLGERRSVIDQRAMALFVQDNIVVHDSLTLELGMRYEWHVTPTERDDRFVVFDRDSGSLVRVGEDLDRIYQQNNANLEPRLGLAWTPTSGGRTGVRAAYARAVDQPSTTAVRDTAGNPPFAAPLTASGAIPIDGAIDSTRPAGLAPATIDPQFRNASLQSWNVNVQRQLARKLALALGYSGSHGSNLRISRNLNQPVNGIRPYPSVSAESAIRPGTTLGNITQVESSGFSNYQSAWVAVTRRLSRGLQFDTSYTWSKSLDTNSLNSSGFAIQNSYDIASEYGLSDFAARHRFILSAIYSLPFNGSIVTRGWQVATVVQSQSGNPVNIVTSNSSLNGLPNTVRPDVTGPIPILGEVDRWFDPSVFVAVNRFGTLGRNAVIGPAFHNTDVSLIKNVRPGPRMGLQFDWRQLRRWGISETRVPAEAQVLFREPGVWDQYKGYILAAVAVFLAQTGLIGGLLVQAGRRRRAEARIRDLGSRLLGAQEAERSRIARELHDDVSQQTALLSIDLQLLIDSDPDEPDTREELARKALRRTEAIAQTVHALSRRLHPAKLRLMGLDPSLSSLQREFSKTDVAVTFMHRNVPDRLPFDLTLCLFRIVQEALQNAVKHGSARKVSVDLTGGPKGLILAIVDDGVGFDVNALSAQGLGLVSMRERLEPLGGTLEIHSRPGTGTRLTAFVPGPPAASAAASTP